MSEPLKRISMEEFEERYAAQPSTGRIQVHVHEKWYLGKGCTARVATFGGMPYLLPENWVPVLSEDGTRVTLKEVSEGK